MLRQAISVFPSGFERELSCFHITAASNGTWNCSGLPIDAGRASAGGGANVRAATIPVAWRGHAGA